MAFSLFPALFEHPLDMRFVEQEKDEVIELLLRQHWVTNIVWVVVFTIGFLIPVAILYFLSVPTISLLYQIPQEIIWGFIALWYLLLIAYALEKFLHWYFNIYIVTDKHLVDINFYSILNRDIQEVSLENIESASSQISGLLRSFFNFGNVIIQTAAENQQITFLDVPYPDKVVDRVNDLREERGIKRAH